MQVSKGNHREEVSYHVQRVIAILSETPSEFLMDVCHTFLLYLKANLAPIGETNESLFRQVGSSPALQHLSTHAWKSKHEFSSTQPFPGYTPADTGFRGEDPQGSGSANQLYTTNLPSQNDTFYSKEDCPPSADGGSLAVGDEIQSLTCDSDSQRTASSTNSSRQAYSNLEIQDTGQRLGDVGASGRNIDLVAAKALVVTKSTETGGESRANKSSLTNELALAAKSEPAPKIQELLKLVEPSKDDLLKCLNKTPLKTLCNNWRQNEECDDLLLRLESTFQRPDVPRKIGLVFVDYAWLQRFKRSGARSVEKFAACFEGREGSILRSVRLGKTVDQLEQKLSGSAIIAGMARSKMKEINIKTEDDAISVAQALRSSSSYKVILEKLEGTGQLLDDFVEWVIPQCQTHKTNAYDNEDQRYNSSSCQNQADLPMTTLPYKENDFNFCHTSQQTYRSRPKRGASSNEVQMPKRVRTDWWYEVGTDAPSPAIQQLDNQNAMDDSDNLLAPTSTDQCFDEILDTIFDSSNNLPPPVSMDDSFDEVLDTIFDSSNSLPPPVSMDDSFDEVLDTIFDSDNLLSVTSSENGLSNVTSTTPETSIVTHEDAFLLVPNISTPLVGGTGLIYHEARHSDFRMQRQEVESF